jgi:hypothetical protein
MLPLLGQKSMSVITVDASMKEEESEEEEGCVVVGLFSTPSRGRNDEEKACHKERVPSARSVAKFPSLWHLIRVMCMGFSYIKTCRGMPDPFRLKNDNEPPEDATTAYSLAIQPHKACPLIESSVDDCMIKCDLVR